MPERIQLRRTKGWRKPEGAIVVARPSRWGNPWRVTKCNRIECGPEVTRWCVFLGNEAHHWHHQSRADAHRRAVGLFRAYLLHMHGTLTPSAWQLDMGELAGRDLACWCPLEDAQGRRVPCHADVLLELANEDGGNPT